MLAALAAIRDDGHTISAQGDGPATGSDEDVQQHQVPDGTVRSENA